MAASISAQVSTSHSSSLIPVPQYPGAGKGAVDISSSSEKRLQAFTEVEGVLNRSLQNENELLRCQLNDLISREKSQRVELQRLQQHRDAEVASMVQTATVQLKSEVEQLKGMLQSTSGQLLQALTEREQSRSQKEQCIQALEETKQAVAVQETHLTQKLHSLEEALKVGASLAADLADSLDAFQHHVLPTFRHTGLEINKNSLKANLDLAEAQILFDQLARLENGLTLLQVIVDAKTDTLVLIRGKLKQENDELRVELQAAQEAKQDPQPHPKHNFTDDICPEKARLCHELQSLQSLFNEEVTQLKAKLKMYENQEQRGQGHLTELLKEVAALQKKLSEVEASRASLEASLKEETSSHSQLVSQLFTLRKESEKAKAELETLKLSQKFFARQPHNGQIPIEKMDMMNTINQLLAELNKLKGEKVALEEELKAQKLLQVRDRIQRTVTSRDVEMVVSNKVGDTELASKLARARLQKLALQESHPNASLFSNQIINDRPQCTSKSNTGLGFDVPPDLIHNGLHLQKCDLTPKTRS